MQPLIDELHKRNMIGEYDDLIQDAEDGLFGDFTSPLLAPKMELVFRLSLYPELYDLAERVKAGEFDD